MELKYILHFFFASAAAALCLAPTGLTFTTFDITPQEEMCGQGKVRAMGGFAVMTCIISLIAWILAIVSLFKPLKIVNLVFDGITFAFSVIPWAISADLWEIQSVYKGVTVANCGLPHFGMPFLPLFVSCTGSAIFAIIVLLVLADAAAAPAEGAKPAEAGNVDNNKKAEETPQPKDDEEAKKKEAAAKKKADDEAAAAAAKKKADDEAAAKKKADDEAAAKKKADDEAAANKKKADDAAAAAAQKKAADDQAAAAAAQKKKDEEAAAAAAAAKKKADEEAAAAAAKKKADEEAAAKNKKPAIDWKAINAKLPYDKKNAEQKKRRFEMFDMMDANKTGKVSLAEVQAGMQTVLNLGKELDVPVVIKTAFDKAKVAGQQAGVNEDAAGGDFIEKNEFRLFLMYTRMYFELYHLFSDLDETGDMRIELAEFEKAIPLLKTWGAKIDNAAATFSQIDKNGGGKVLFGEFVDWALSPEQNLDCPDDDE